ncbi:MAG: alpha/beta hydrolase [Tabrizicola sp.]|nr:alpha/beta hydrolase [Tabrizicola sp.]
MPGMIRRTLLIGGLVAAAGGAVLWRSRNPGGVDLAYGPDPQQRLDIHFPRGSQAHPVLVRFHGGDFASGDKSELTIWPEAIEAGIAVARVNTRLSGSAKWPAQVDDALAAVIHLQREARSLGIDPSRMVIMGQGAGAMLAVAAAIRLIEVGLPPQGVVSLYGPMDFSTLDADMATLGRPPARGPADEPQSPESQVLGFTIAENRAEARAASPLARLELLHEPLPPILIRHGDADAIVADLQAKRLREAWLAADPKASIDYKLVPGAGHGGEAFEAGDVIADILAFLTRVLG